MSTGHAVAMVQISIRHLTSVEAVVIVRCIAFLHRQRLCHAHRDTSQEQAYNDKKTSHNTPFLWFAGRKVGILSRTTNKKSFFMQPVERFCVTLHA